MTTLSTSTARTAVATGLLLSSGSLSGSGAPLLSGAGAVALTSAVTGGSALNMSTATTAIGSAVTLDKGLFPGTTNADTIFGTPSADSISGDAGNDTLQGGAGADSLDGGAGDDWLSYSAGTAGVTVNLGTGLAAGGDATGDSFTRFEGVQGSRQADLLVGSDANDTLRGWWGADTLIGGEGADLLDGDIVPAVDYGSPAVLPAIMYMVAPQTFVSYAGAKTGVTLTFRGQLVYVDALHTVEGNVGVGSAGEALGDTLLNIGGLEGSNFGDTLLGHGSMSLLMGLDGDDHLYGADSLVGGDGNDKLYATEKFVPAPPIFSEFTKLSGGSGNNLIVGSRLGNDLALYRETSSAQIGVTKGPNGTWFVSHSEGGGGVDTLTAVEAIELIDGTFKIAGYSVDYLASGDWVRPDEVPSFNMGGKTGGFEDLFSVFDGALGAIYRFGATYSGPVSYLQKAFFGTTQGEVMGGTRGNDQINSFGGTDAVDAGAGDDVIDGGTGSNFLTGGAGKDVFFLDGRNPIGEPTWSTIRDWQAGEQLSVFGFLPGISRFFFQPSDGASGFTGVTMHADLDGNGVIDNSVTWSGRSSEDLPSPIMSDGVMWFT